MVVHRWCGMVSFEVANHTWGRDCLWRQLCAKRSCAHQWGVLLTWQRLPFTWESSMELWRGCCTPCYLNYMHVIRGGTPRKFAGTGSDSFNEMKRIVGFLAEFTIMQAPRQGVCHYNSKISLTHNWLSVVSQILYSTVCNKLAWFERTISNEYICAALSWASRYCTIALRIRGPAAVGYNHLK